MDQPVFCTHNYPAIKDVLAGACHAFDRAIAIRKALGDEKPLKEAIELRKKLCGDPGR